MHSHVCTHSWVRPSVCPSVCLSVHPSVRMSVRLCICLYVRLSVHPSGCLSIRQYVCPSISMSVRPSVCLSVRPHVSACPCVRMCVGYYNLASLRTQPPTPRLRLTKPPGGHVFWRIMRAWTILVEGQQSNILPSYIELGPTVSYEKIFKVSYIDI